MAGAGLALDTALALLDSPTRLALCRAQPLPDDVLPLIRIAAGDEESRRLASVASHRPEALVAEAAVFYIQHVLFDAGSDSYRTLGVGADWPSDRIKEHYRWLVRWLHPDRNTDEWDAIYADRVNRAWNDLRTPERRREYDQARAAAPVRRDEVPVAPVGYRPPPLETAYVEPARLSAQTRKRLPTLIFGGLSLVAVLGLTLMYLGQQPAVGEGMEVALPEAAPVAQAEPAPVPTSPPAPLPAPPPPKSVPPKSVPAVAAPSLPRPLLMPSDKSRTARAANLVRPPPKLSPPVRTPAPAAKPTPDPKPAPRLAASAPAIAMSATAPRASSPNPSRVASRPAEKVNSAPPVPAVAASPVQATVSVPASAPAGTAAVAADLPTLPADLDLASVNDLLRRFRGAYASGDLSRMQPLLAQRGGTLARDQVLQRYQRLFADSSSRRLEIRDPSWRGSEAHAVILAAVDSWWMPTGRDDTEHAAGKLRLDLVWEDGQWRIQDLHHDERGR